MVVEGSREGERGGGVQGLRVGFGLFAFFVSTVLLFMSSFSVSGNFCGLCN